MRTRLKVLVWRRVVLAADVVFGLVLLVVGLEGGVSVPASSGMVAPRTAAAAAQVDVAARLGGLSPPGQSTGLAVAPDGSLAVVDRGREVVIRLDPNGQPMAEWGPRFGPDLEAQDLVGIAPDGDGWYVLDRGAQRILRLDPSGQAVPQRTINLEPLATYGPNGLATDVHGNLYLVDTGRNRLVVFDSSGRMTAEFGDGGGELGKFKQPMFAAFGPDGSLFVTDWENSRIQRWDSERRPVAAWPIQPHAWGIAVDGLGRVFVPDGDRRAVRMFGPDGSLLAQIGGEGAPPIPVEFPSQVATSPDGSKLWILGSDGLATADLAPFAGIRPTAAAPQTARPPLAALGTMLVLLAAVAVGRPWLTVGANALFAARVGGASHAAAQVGESAPPEDSAPAASVLLRPPGLLALLPSVPRQLAGLAGGALFLVGAVAAGLAAINVADPVARNDPWPRLAWLAGASLVCAIGASFSGLAWPWRWVTAAWPGCPVTDQTRFSLFTLGSAFVSVLLAATAGLTWWQGRFQTPEATRGAVLWLVAILFAVASLISASRPRLPKPSPWLAVPWILFAIALIPRAWHNADLPFGVWYDEAEAGLQARRFLNEGRFTPITDTYGRDASGFYYLIAAAQFVIKDPVLAGRLVAGIVGALCAPLLYFLGRELFGWRVGLVAGLVIATSRWHLNVSRLGWDPISLPLTAILAFWLVARAMRTSRWTDAGWAGLAVGLGLHAYIGYRSLPIVAVLMLGYAGWQQRWSLVTTLSRFGPIGGAAVLTALPVIIFAIQDPAGYNGRFNQTLILNEPISQAQKLDALWSSLLKHTLMFHVSGDMNGRHNLPGAPMLDPLSGLLMVVGLGVLIARPLDWRSLLLMGWAAASLAGGIFTFPFEAPQAMRSLGVTPVLALLVALALVLVVDRAAVFLPSRQAFASVSMAVLGGAAAAWIGATNVDTFFSRQMNDPTVWGSFSTRETLPSRAALAAPQPYEAILGSPTIAPSLQQQLMVPDVQRTMRGFDATTDLPYRGNGPGLVVLETEHDAGLVEEVARFYPDALRRPIVPPNGSKPLVEELVLEPDVIAAHRGLASAYRGADGSYLQRYEPGPVVNADSAPVALPADVGLRAALALDAPGVYAFRVPAGFLLTLDGSQVAPSDRLQLARGNHLLSVTGSLKAGARLQVEWLPAGAADWLLVDERMLFVAPPGGNGLEATFYPTPDWNGSPTETVIDPILDHYYHINPLSRLSIGPPTWSAEWSGSLEVPTDGAYRFEAERLTRAGLWIDDQRVFDDTVDSPSAGSSAVAQLTAGRHQIRVRLQNRGDGGPRLYLFWIPPGGAREIVPGRVLYPPPARSVP